MMKIFCCYANQIERIYLRHDLCQAVTSWGAYNALCTCAQSQQLNKPGIAQEKKRSEEKRRERDKKQHWAKKWKEKNEQTKRWTNEWAVCEILRSLYCDKHRDMKLFNLATQPAIERTSFKSNEIDRFEFTNNNNNKYGSMEIWKYGKKKNYIQKKFTIETNDFVIWSYDYINSKFYQVPGANSIYALRPKSSTNLHPINDQFVYLDNKYSVLW